MDTAIASHTVTLTKQLARGLIAAATIATAATATAQIELYTARVVQHYSQTSDAAPVADFYRFDAQLRTVNVGDGEWVTLAGSTLNSGSLQNLAVTGRTWSLTSQAYGSMPALKNDYPIPQTYFMEIGGGVFVEPKQVGVIVDHNFPDAVPFLTGTTFSGLNNWNPSLSNFLMTFNSHSDSGLSDPNYVKTYVTFYDQTTNDGNPISWFLGNSATSLLLDGNLFTAGHEYTGHLQFFHQYSDTSSDFFGSINGLTTSFDFTTSTSGQTPGDIPPGAVPEPSTYGLLGAAALCALVAYRRRQKRTA